MLDFSFFKAHSEMEALELEGRDSYLRDENGKVVLLCNDHDASFMLHSPICFNLGRVKLHMWLVCGFMLRTVNLFVWSFQ
jgi:hypothetical protein